MTIGRLWHACFFAFHIGLLAMGQKGIRQLKFPKGSTLAWSVALGTHFPKGPLYDGLAHLLEFDLGYPIPDDVVYNPGKADEKTWNGWNAYQSWNRYGIRNARSKRSEKDVTKKRLLSTMENAIARVGYNGPACVSRFQCELHQLTSSNYLIEEILQAVFPSADDDCENSVVNCPFSLLHILLHSQQRSIYTSM